MRAVRHPIFFAAHFVGVLLVALTQLAALPASAQVSAPVHGPMWVKLCETVPDVGKDTDGRDVHAGKVICLTHHEQLDSLSGMVLVSAAIREIEGVAKKQLVVLLPGAMALPAGIQIGVYRKGLWDKFQNGETVDDRTATLIKLTSTLCHAAGCTAETEATPEILEQLSGAAGMIVSAVNERGKLLSFAVPLAGHQQAIEGKPADPRVYWSDRGKIFGPPVVTQQNMIDAYRRQTEELQKLTPGGQKRAPGCDTGSCEQAVTFRQAKERARLFDSTAARTVRREGSAIGRSRQSRRMGFL
jgi:invasion protein IalB